MDSILEPGLVLNLPLYEMDGSNIQSRDKNGHLCTVTGAVWKLNGRYLDGLDDYLAISHNQSLNILSACTFIFWLRLNSLASDRTVFTKGSWESDGQEVYINTGGALVYLTHQSGAHQQTSTSNGIVTINNWVCLAITREGADCRMYKDGIDLAVASASHQDPVSNSRDVFIGTNVVGGADFYGSIAEILWYNRKLSQQEIKRNYLTTKWRYR